MRYDTPRMSQGSRRINRGWWRFLVILAGCVCVGVAAADETGDALRAQASALYTQRDYARAAEAWRRVAEHGVPDADRARLDFYLADSLWRSQPGPSGMAEARQLLASVIEREPDTPLAAEAWESIGDSWLAQERDWPQAWDAYQQALAYWANSSDLDLARERYLGIVWKATGPPTDASRVALLPIDVLNNALAIARTEENVARARYFLGLWLEDQGDAFSLRRAGAEWSQVIALGPGTAVYESALYRLARWALVAGSSRWEPDGELIVEPNFTRAFGLFRRYLDEFPGGTSQYGPDVSQQLAELTRTELSAHTAVTFLPGSDPVLRIRTRNIDRVQIDMHRVDLLADFRPGKEIDPADWTRGLRVEGREVVRTWEQEVHVQERFQPTDSAIRIGSDLGPGAYLVTLRGGDLTERALVLVSTTVALLKPSAEWVVATIADAESGKTVSTPSVRLWQAARSADGWQWTAVEPQEGSTDILRFHLPDGAGRISSELLLLASEAESPVFLTSHSASRLNTADGWRSRFVSSRELATPGDRVEWKVIAREVTNGVMVTPADVDVEWRIVDPNGDETHRGELRLSPFGGGWGRFQTEPGMPLGDYSIEVYRGLDLVGESTLFRLEESAPAPFSVDLAIPGQTGRTVRLGQTLRVRVLAEYRAGGGVADATVEVRVRESSFSGSSEDADSAGAGDLTRVVRKEELRTAPNGSVVIEIPTPPDAPESLVYEVDVAVRDASGHEESARRQFVVAKQMYFVDLQTSSKLVTPLETVRLAIMAQDANGTPVTARGRVTVYREVWREVWLRPNGTEVSGAELDALRGAAFPPAGESGWRLKSRSIEAEEVEGSDIQTGADGVAVFEFTPETPGIFRFEWRAEERDGPPILSTTRVWAADATTTDMAYRGRPLRLVTDARTLREDGGARVLVLTDTPGRDVLLTVGAGLEIYHSEIISMQGDAKLVEIPAHSGLPPNAFVQAAVVRGSEVFADSLEIRFPNWNDRIEVRLEEIEPRMRPGERTNLRVVARDNAGDPVEAEFLIAVFPDSSAPAESDPLQTFHGGLRFQSTGIVTSFGERRTVFETEAIRASALLAGESSDPQRVMPAPVPIIHFADPERLMAGDLQQPELLEAVQSGNTGNYTLWRPGVRTAADGTASISFRMPDIVGNWRVMVWAASAGEKFGFAEAVVTTTLPLITTIGSPPFLVSGDQLNLVTTFGNGGDTAIRARATLVTDGVTAEKESGDFRIAAGEESRLEWPLNAPDPGVATLRLSVSGSGIEDETTVDFPIRSAGIPMEIAANRPVREGVVEMGLTLPAETSEPRLRVSLARGLGQALTLAAPTLVRNGANSSLSATARLFPTAVLREALVESARMSPASWSSWLFPDWEPDEPDPWAPFVNKALQQIYDLQLADGSWPWARGGASDPWMSAWVVGGLRTAQTSAVGIREDRLESGLEWLRTAIDGAADSPGLAAWMLRAIASVEASRGGAANADTVARFNALFRQRDQAGSDGLALLAWIARDIGQKNRAEALAKELLQKAVTDPDTSGLRWTAAENAAWQSGLSDLETTAVATSVMATILQDRDAALQGADTVLRACKVDTWGNPRTDSIVVALLAPLVAWPDGGSNSRSVALAINGTRTPIPESPLDHPIILEIPREAIREGQNLVRLHAEGGEGTVYFGAALDFRTTSPPAAESALEISRTFSRLEADETLLNGWTYQSAAWDEATPLTLNSRLDATLVLSAASPHRYVQVFVGMSAGLRPVDIHSGSRFSMTNEDGRQIPAIAEVKDHEIVFYIPELPEGRWQLRYQVRAAFAGKFHGPAAIVHPAYSPDRRAVTPEIQFEILPSE